MAGVLGMRVQDATEIYEARQRRHLDALGVPSLDVRMNGREAGQRESFQIGVSGTRRLAGCPRGRDHQQGKDHKRAERKAAP
jgi:hypothetical protein